jgi:hypothetical protein
VQWSVAVVPPEPKLDEAAAAFVAADARFVVIGGTRRR